MKIEFVGGTAALENKARRASEAAAKSVFATLNSRFQAAIYGKKWDWPNVTIRGRGKDKDGNPTAGFKVGSPRNIVDTGALGESNPGPEISGLSVTYRWTVTYAAAVHEGYSLRGGGVVPARPWTSAVLGTEKVSGIEPYDYTQAFRDAWLRAFNA